MTPVETFIYEHGFRANFRHLAHILGISPDEVLSIRVRTGGKRLPAAKPFPELFALWHGRSPMESDWPVPWSCGRNGYEWLAPEEALLATLVGTLGTEEISEVLTRRLRELTGNPHAERSRNSVIVRMGLIGLQTHDVLGGITTTQAAQETGSLPMVQDAIRQGTLKTIRVGRRLVIPYTAWEAWKSDREEPPENFIPLTSLKQRLSIKSDKLSEFARMGYIPTARRYKTFGATGTSRNGTWYIDSKVAEQLLANRQAGLAMPWHGKPMLDNLRVTYKLWKERQHPAECKTCKSIWDKAGAPRDFDDYIKRYPPLAHGAKRHLTMVWTPGMTIPEVAAACGCSVSYVRRAIQAGIIETTTIKGRRYVSRTEVTRWKARKLPNGDNVKSWLSLQTASKQYLFSVAELRKFIQEKKLKSKIGEFGASRGIVYVLKHQCRLLREGLGFTEAEAAKRAGVSIKRFRELVEGVDWRQADGIPLETLQAVIKRLQSKEGYTLEEAAEKLGMPLQWVVDRKNDGTVRVLRSKGNQDRVYLSEPMMRRLSEAKENPANKPDEPQRSAKWLTQSEAAVDAGVCVATLIAWAKSGDVVRHKSSRYWLYHRDTVRIRARRYWASVRFLRAKPPSWLQSASREVRSSP